MALVEEDEMLPSFVESCRNLEFEHTAYPEERADFRLPDAWLRVVKCNKAEYLPSGICSTESSTLYINDDRVQLEKGDDVSSAVRISLNAAGSAAATLSNRKPSVGHHYSTDDPENPWNWANLRRFLVALVLYLCTFVVYMSSAIFINSVPGVAKGFGVSSTEASLGLALFCLGLRCRPLALVAATQRGFPVGRNPVYFRTMLAFVILSIPTALVTNYPGLVVLRFLRGFFGSPCLANGGASAGNFAPAIGPIPSGFSVPVPGWRWSLPEILFAGPAILPVMFVFLPETSSATLLLQRAQRLRRLTDNPAFMSQSEIAQRDMSSRDILVDALIKPLEITIKDPAILFVQLYTAIVYATYYSFFESFPLMYPVYYEMTPGEVGLVFLAILVACLIGRGLYASYIYFYVNPRIRAVGVPAAETRLIPALVAAFGPTLGLFVFGWTARPDIQWIAPTADITIYNTSHFILFRRIFVYVPLSYPKYAASLFAGNGFFRSALAFAAVLFAPPLFEDLGIARGNSLLGGISVVGIVGIWR
ncbi:major facilitator superfamily transporter [Xylaria acuta]|nr:major facilitator superfamily transporter [Xylaria acuta]